MNKGKAFREGRLMIRDAVKADAGRIAEIYNHYVLNTLVTFEETPISVDEMRQRIQNVTTEGYPWIVLEENAVLIGYAYASQWRARSAYRFTLESTVYLDQARKGKGAGTQIYQALLDRLKEAGVRVVIGGIALPNPESARLHEKLGFIKVAHFPEVGFKFGQWIDVGFWQLTLK